MLNTAAEIAAALAGMESMAREASLTLASGLIAAGPSVAGSSYHAAELQTQACVGAMTRAGWAPPQDEAKITAFFDRHMDEIGTVGISLFSYAHDRTVAEHGTYDWERAMQHLHPFAQ